MLEVIIYIVLEGRIYEDYIIIWDMGFFQLNFIFIYYLIFLFNKIIFYLWFGLREKYRLQRNEGLSQGKEIN